MLKAIWLSQIALDSFDLSGFWFKKQDDETHFCCIEVTYILVVTPFTQNVNDQLSAHSTLSAEHQTDTPRVIEIEDLFHTVDCLYSAESHE